MQNTCSVYQSDVKFCIGAFRPPGVLSQGMDVQRGSVRKPQHGGANFDPPMIFCACSIQNTPCSTPAASEILQDDFRTK
jgi:hypothetical protein